MIKFSVITICLNAGQDLLETVNSTLEQTYTNFEIVVKDGLSKDGYIEMLPQDDRINLVRKKDSSLYDAMNQGIDEVTGDYVIFMNCGDLFYSKNTLEILARAIEKQRAPMYYGLCYNRMMDHTNAYPRKITRLTCFRTMICHQSTVYAAELLRERKYDLSYKIYADRELLLYLVCEKKIEPVYIDTTVVNYKAGGECEKKEYSEQNAKDLKRMTDKYFPKSEQLRYKFMMAFTFAKLRQVLSTNPRYSKYYYGLIKKIYSLVR